MRLDIGEVYFIKEAVGTISIKATDAPKVAKLFEKLDKEFERLQKLEDKKVETQD